MKKVVSLLIAIAMVLPLLCLPVSAIEYDAIEYIVNNVDTLAEVYAQLHPDSDEVFEGQSVEFMLPVAIVSTDSVGTYIDFDGDNGYMVVQGNNDVIAWEASGDLLYLKNLETTYYSIVDGFGYIDGGVFTPYELNEADTESMVAASPYQGQNSAGDGDIVNYELYMLDRYDSHYQLVEVAYLNYPFDYVEQSDFAVYSFLDLDNSWKPEGNCALSSIYALLNYLEISGKCNFPTTPMTYYPSYDSFYEEYKDYPEYRAVSSKELPLLYYAVRRCAIDDYGYRVQGLNAIYHTGVIETVSSIYSNNVDATLHTLGSFDSYVVPELQNRNPVLLTVNGSDTYSDHAMVVTGYHIYRKTTTILGINFNDYVYLLRVNDNWSDAARYFDWTAFGGTWAYVTVEVNN